MAGESILNAKDFVIFGGFGITAASTLISIAVMWTKMNGRILNNESDIKRLSEFFKKVLLDHNGEIRLQDKQKCEEHRSSIQLSIKDNHAKILDTQADMSDKIQDMSENILLLIYHLNVDPQNKRIKLGGGHSERENR